MKFSSAAVLLAAATVDAHYVFKNIIVGGKTSADWVNVRKTTNYQSNGPVTDVSSSQMTCYQLAPGNEGAKTVTVKAGDTMAYVATSSVSHPGPLSFWMAKAPSGQTADQMTGEGPVWFKISQDYPTITSQSITWPSMGKTTLNVKIPSCIPSGDYLLRVEHIALHSAGSVGGAQLYISCAQLTVEGGSGSLPSNLVSIPGVYKATDPGLLVNIYYPIPVNYKPPGGAPLQC